MEPKTKTQKTKPDLEYITSFLGNEYINFNKPGNKWTAEECFKNIKLFGLLFAANYTPPARSFVDSYLTPFYKEINDESRQMEVLYIPMDKKFDDFKRFFIGSSGSRPNGMPWSALKYQDNRIETLKEKFGIKHIPSLVILNAQGEVVSFEGRTDLMTVEFDAFPKWIKQNEQMQADKIRLAEEKKLAQEKAEQMEAEGGTAGEK